MQQFYEEITRFVFKEDDPAPSDVIWIPGGDSPELPEKAAELYRQGLASILIPSGRFSITKGEFQGSESQKSRYPGDYSTECEFYCRVLREQGVPEEAILPECRAVYTLQNAQFSKELTDAQGIAVKRGLLCCKSFHARRAYQYYQYIYPDAEIRVIPVDVYGISRGNWMETPEGRRKALRELSKCGSQFEGMLC